MWAFMCTTRHDVWLLRKLYTDLTSSRKHMKERGRKKERKRMSERERGERKSKQKIPK